MAENNSLFTLREARENDMPYIDSYAYAEGMDYVRSHENIIVAVNPSDEPVGFIRISYGESGCAYVNPVVVHKTWRGYDVGKALMEDALQRHGELRLVARGSSAGFYKQLGYEECGWDMIEDGVSEDCVNCSWRDECGPIPMRKVYSE